MKEKGHKICRVAPESIAQEMGVEPGDYLLAVNGSEIEDIFDYRYLTEEEYIEVTVKKQNGEEWILEIDKDYEEDLGIEFDNGLMDEYRSCQNKCMFCFIDQMPKGMRETLYFKDDDSRLSFLQGNYVTLTNMQDRDIERIIKFHLAPINISFHTTNKELRCKMLNNRFAGEALDKVDKLYQAGIEMNGQIVLCKGVNDREELNRTVSDLTKYIPHLKSVSVVPVGLTKFREGLYPLQPFSKEDAKEVLRTIHSWQDKIYEEYGTHFIHAGDEWYLLAEEALQEADSYDGFIQYENGVGMLRMLLDEFEESYETLSGGEQEARLSIATGVLAYPFIKRLSEKIMEKYPNIQIHTYQIINCFFGEQITVAGLLTGQDLLAQLKDRELGERLLLTGGLLRSGDQVFLDDMTVKDLEKALQVKITIVKSSGQDFIDAVLESR